MDDQVCYKGAPKLEKLMQACDHSSISSLSNLGLINLVVYLNPISDHGPRYRSGHVFYPLVSAKRTPPCVIFLEMRRSRLG